MFRCERTKRLPVLYVFGHEEVDTDDLVSQFQAQYPQTHSDIPILILYDVIYSHITGSIVNRVLIDCFAYKCFFFLMITDAIKSCLASVYSNVVISEILMPDGHKLGTTSDDVISTRGEPSSNGNNETCDSHVTGQTTVMFGRVLNTTRPLADYRILYIGEEGPTLTNFMLTLKDNEVKKKTSSICSAVLLHSFYYSVRFLQSSFQDHQT